MTTKGTPLSLAIGKSGRSMGERRQRRQPGGQQPFIEGIATGRYGLSSAYCHWHEARVRNLFPVALAQLSSRCRSRPEGGFHPWLIR